MANVHRTRIAEPQLTDNRRTIYRATKTYDHAEGLSCCFRQWRAGHSHCKLLHGYALAFKFIFASHELDGHKWCFDFGGLKEVRAWLHDQFDHTLVIAADDPQLEAFVELERLGLADVRIMSSVGCEETARFAFEHVSSLIDRTTDGRAWLESVEVREHGGNSAIYECSR